MKVHYREYHRRRGLYDRIQQPRLHRFLRWRSDNRRWGRTRWSSCRSWSVEHERTYEWPNWAAWLQRPYCKYMRFQITGRTYTGAYTFSKTIPFAWEAPPKGLAFQRVPRWAFLYSLSCHLCSRRWLTCLRAVRSPLGLPNQNRTSLHCVQTWRIAWSARVPLCTTAVFERSLLRWVSSLLGKAINNTRCCLWTQICSYKMNFSTCLTHVVWCVPVKVSP